MTAQHSTALQPVLGLACAYDTLQDDTVQQAVICFLAQWEEGLGNAAIWAAVECVEC